MSDPKFLSRKDFSCLLDELIKAGYTCIGPVVRDNAIVFDTIESVNKLPQGVQITQEPGVYRLEHTNGKRLFSWSNGPQALKPLMFRPRENLWVSERDENGTLCFTETLPDVHPIAVIGVRSCDIAALYIQDKHFMHSAFPDPYYEQRRKKVFLVAVNCTHSSKTCFCVSTGDGPGVTYGYDLALSELDEGFVIVARSTRGAEVLARLPVKDISPEQLEAAEKEKTPDSEREADKKTIIPRQNNE